MGEELKNMIRELVNEVSDEDLLDLVYKLLLSGLQHPPGFGV